MAIHRNTTRKVIQNSEFLNEVEEGLSAANKFLSSKYFYDEIGDKLFQQIMHLPEYYLTKAEHEIFKSKSLEMIGSFNLNKQTPFELVELGAGDGTKTKELLGKLLREKYTFKYVPIDISSHAIDSLEHALLKEFPNLEVRGRVGRYFEVLKDLKLSSVPKVVLFLGSNLGNMSDDRATAFISELSNTLAENDKLLLGLDLIKSKQIVLPAYNDASGVTAKFNLNLLERINKEFDANFKVSQFDHAPEYDENEGIARSYLKSNENQEVYIGALDRSFFFAENERLFMETSRKYDLSILKDIIGESKFSIQDSFTDSNNYFTNFLLHRHD